MVIVPYLTEHLLCDNIVLRFYMYRLTVSFSYYHPILQMEQPADKCLDKAVTGM